MIIINTSSRGIKQTSIYTGPGEEVWPLASGYSTTAYERVAPPAVLAVEVRGRRIAFTGSAR